jgi:hypothetical protein
MDKDHQPQQLPPKPPELTQEEWQEQLDEMRAYSQHVWRQSGGRLDTFRLWVSQQLRKK